MQPPREPSWTMRMYPRPHSRTISQQASENSGTVNNFIQFDIAPLTEGSAQISLTITGTATAGQDYETPDTMLTLSPRQSQFSEPITINDDNVYEISETVIVTLVAESDNIQIDPITGTKTLYISDNDDPADPVLRRAADQQIRRRRTTGRSRSLPSTKPD